MLGKMRHFSGLRNRSKWSISPVQCSWPAYGCLPRGKSGIRAPSICGLAIPVASESSAPKQQRERGRIWRKTTCFLNTLSQKQHTSLLLTLHRQELVRWALLHTRKAGKWSPCFCWDGTIPHVGKESMAHIFDK